MMVSMQESEFKEVEKLVKEIHELAQMAEKGGDVLPFALFKIRVKSRRIESIYRFVNQVFVVQKAHEEKAQGKKACERA